MAYTAVPTVTTGETWTAANHNTYIKDNFAAGIPDIMTAKGDLVAGTGADAASVLNVGTDGYYLTSDSDAASGMSWQNIPAAITARHTRNSTAAIADDTVTIIDYDDVGWDSDSRITAGASWRFDAVGAEYLLVIGSVALEASTWAAGQELALYVYVSDTEYAVIDYLGHVNTDASVKVHLHGATLVECADTDFVDIRIKQVTGGERGIEANSSYNYAAIAVLK